MADIVGIDTSIAGKVSGTVELAERVLQMCKSGQIRGLAVVGMMDERHRFLAKFYEGEDSSSIIGEVAILLHELCEGQRRGTVGD